MNLFESITDRAVREAREAGLFDDLPGAGKPIADIDQRRPAGWWATRFVKNERSRLKREELDFDVRAAMPALWRLDTPTAVRGEVERLNELVGEYNRVTSLEPAPKLDADATVERWRQLRAC